MERLKKYKSLKDLPGYSAGTIWVRDERINPMESLGYFPEFRQRTSWIFYLPTKCVENESDWFEEIKENPVEVTGNVHEPKFSENDMVDFGWYVKNRKKFAVKDLSVPDLLT